MSEQETHVGCHMAMFFLISAASLVCLYQPVCGEAAPQYILEGTIIDSASAPIHGATVQWYSTRWCRVDDQAVTDASGYYRMSLPKVRPDHWICVRAKGYAPYKQCPSPFQPKGKQTTAKIMLMPGHWLKGRVTHELGDAISGATVTVTEPSYDFYVSFYYVPAPSFQDWQKQSKNTDADSRFQFEDLPDGEVHLTVEAPGYETRSQNCPVDKYFVVEMKQKEEHAQSQSQNELQGRVVDSETGTPIPSFTVYLNDISQSFHASDGRFVYSNLSDYCCDFVLVDATGYEPLAAENLKPANAPTTLHFKTDQGVLEARISNEDTLQAEEHLFSMKKGKGLEGIVLDARTGKGISGVNILYGKTDEMSYFDWSDFSIYNNHSGGLSRSMRTKTGEDGTFRIPESTLFHGTLAIIHEGYERVFLLPDERIYDPETGILKVILQPETIITGVYKAAGIPVAGASIEIMNIGPSAQKQNLRFQYESTKTDRNGQFTFHNLNPDKYSVYLRIWTDTWGYGGLTRTLTLHSAQENRIDLIEGEGPITLKGRLLPPWTPFSLHPQFDGVYTQYAGQSDAEGFYVVKGIEPGKYEVTLSGYYEFVKSTIEVQQDTEIDLTLQRNK